MAILLMFLDGLFISSLTVVLSGLVFWDLSAFLRRTKPLSQVQQERQLILRHGTWLVIPICLAVAIISLSRVVRLEIGFGQVFSLLLLWGVGFLLLFRWHRMSDV
jgi:hypothetical protein